MIRAIWILLDIGPCLYRYSIEKRFFETDENLFSGFFVALETFAKSIGSEEVLKVEMRDLSLWFKKGPNVVHVVASDRDEDMNETLLKISRVFSEASQDLSTSSFNPFISSNVTELQHKIDSKIREIVLKPNFGATEVEVPADQHSKAIESVSVAPRKPPISNEPTVTMEIIHRTKDETVEQRRHKTTQQHAKVTGESIPKLEKPLTDTLRERERLVKHFGVAAVDVLHFANGVMTVNEIAEKSRSERALIEDILSFAETLGIIEFKHKK
jgi:predicted flap endonuclease-1-like 5' DNA nuclease